MCSETDALCNAEYGQVSDERVDHRNDCRPLERDTRAGTIEPAIHKPRQGSHLPHWLLERRRGGPATLATPSEHLQGRGPAGRRERLVESVERLGRKVEVQRAAVLPDVVG